MKFKPKILRSVLFITFIVILLARYIPILTRSSQVNQTIDFIFNFEFLSGTELSKKLSDELPSCVDYGSAALDAGGLQSYSFWIMLHINTKENLDLAAQSLIDKNNSAYSTNYTYRKVQLNDPSVRYRKGPAPSWWSCADIKKGYAYVSEGSRCVTIYVDVEKLVVWAMETD